MTGPNTAPQGTPLPGSAQSAGGSDAEEGRDVRAENTRLRQELAREQAAGQKALPWIRMVMQLKESTVGQVILNKLQKNEDLSQLELAAVKQASAQGQQADGEAPLTKAELEEVLVSRDQALVEKLAADRGAEKAMSKLDARAIKELPGYEKLKDSKIWRESLNTIFQLVGNDALSVPSDEKDPYWWAVKRNYHTLISEDPELVKGTKKPAGKDESERLAEILSSGRKPSASDQDTDELAGIPEEYANRIRQIRSIGTGVTGKQFAGPPTSKK